MKKITPGMLGAIAALAAATTLSACGSKTESTNAADTAVTNDVLLNDEPLSNDAFPGDNAADVGNLSDDNAAVGNGL